MKKPKKVPVKRSAKPDVDLNRWCIEMAAKWPTVTSYGSGAQGVYSAGGGLPYQTVDVDLIGRANKIRAWILAIS